MSSWLLVVGLLIAISALGCAYEAKLRPNDSSTIELTPTVTADSEVGRMLIDRWDGQQDGTWGYGRHPFRTLIIDRVSSGDGPWRAEARWGYTDQCCVRVDARVERVGSRLMLWFVGPVGDRYSLRLTRIPPTARALPRAEPIPNLGAIAGTWQGWVTPPAGAERYQIKATIAKQGSYVWFTLADTRWSASGGITLRERYAILKASNGASGTLTLHQHEGDQTLRFVFSGGTVADVTRVR